MNLNIAGSAKGRPIDSESINLGSIPSPAAKEINQLNWFIFLVVCRGAWIRTKGW